MDFSPGDKPVLGESTSPTSEVWFGALVQRSEPRASIMQCAGARARVDLHNMMQNESQSKSGNPEPCSRN